MSYQKLILHGNIGRFDEPRYTPDGAMVLGFSVAYSEGKDKPTTWFNCTAFNKSAEFLQKYFKVGDGIIVDGRIECHPYTAKDGTEKSSWKVSVDKLAFAGGKSSGVVENESHQSEELPARQYSAPAKPAPEAKGSFE